PGGQIALTDSCQNRVLDFQDEPTHHDHDHSSCLRPEGEAVSVLELVLVIVLLAAVLVLLAMLVLRRPSSGGVASDAVLRALADLGALKSNVDAVSNQQSSLGQSLGMLQAAVQGVETKVLESSAGVRDAIGKDLSDARLVVERLKVDAEERRRMEEDVQASARRIETVLLGSRTRGAAGENILQDAFRQFPAQMIDMNFHVNGKVVEYALVLANGKRLPIDSKWPSPELLDRLADELQEPAKEAVVVQEIDDNVTALDRLLENSIARGSTMIQNAFNDAKRNVGQMRGALAAMRAVPQTALGDEPEFQEMAKPDLAVLMSAGDRKAI